MQQKGPVSVLVAPLDWGLGHATRCIPIIKELIKQGATIIIAATGPQKTLLKQEFPGLKYLEIPGYNIGYKPGILLKWGLLFRIPAILKQIKKEKKWLDKTLQDHKIDGIISDNRYGLFHRNIFCVIITHQLYLQSGLGSHGRVDGIWLMVDGWINRILLKYNYRLISKFSSCWIPDQEGNFSIAGKLSQPPFPPPVPVKYIGILSRFIPSEKKFQKNSLLILLSGPEPQRSQFEKMILDQLEGCSMKTIVVRGLPDSADSMSEVKKGIKMYNHLPADQLNQLLIDSEFVVARSGYSTIMDLVRLKKNAILVPTPGQTEQEWLGFYLQNRKWMYMIPQKNFKLGYALDEFQKTKLSFPEISDSLLPDAIEEFLKRITSNEGDTH